MLAQDRTAQLSPRALFLALAAVTLVVLAMAAGTRHPLGDDIVGGDAAGTGYRAQPGVQFRSHRQLHLDQRL